ncbi:MAG: radical SAM protein [Deltaproteobacteria bacterium]|nr:radical SAM protein [Deltaproteobacteria bacterium]
MDQETYAIRQRLDQASLWKGRGPLLGHLDMELTERCNNNCVHCYINLPADDPTVRENELSTGEIKEILKEAASLGCLTVRLTGGEPLLREDFEEIYVFARGLGIKVLLFTNATLITPDIAALLARIPCLEKIEITVYGMNKRSYEAVTRVPGSYEAAWRGINLLLKQNIPFVAKGVLLSSNREEMNEFEKWAATVPWMDGHPSYSMFLDLRCRRDAEEKNRVIKKLRLSVEEVLQVLKGRGERYIREMREFCPRFIGPPDDMLFTCGAGVGGGCVDAYGHFQACMLLRHPDTVYDLKNGSLKHAMTDFIPKVRAMKASDPGYLTRCARCFLKGLCEQCPAKSWMEHGSLDTPVEYLCEIAHAQARYLGLLEEGEMAWEVKDWKERIKRFSGEEPVFNKED